MNSNSATVINVFAASSLTDVFAELAELYEREHADVDVRVNVAGSSQLAAQINAGAPADVFASANQRQLEAVAIDRGLAGTPMTFATNALVVIAPASNPGNINSLDDLSLSGKKVVSAMHGVPIRDYSEIVLENLNAAYGQAFADRVRANIVSEEGNVRQIVIKVALAEADAGIVYASDVRRDVADDLLIFTIPDAFNVRATYFIAAINNDKHTQDFIGFVLAADDVFQQWGFSSVD